MSETGVVPLDEAEVAEKGRLGPGQMITVDLETGQFRGNAEVGRQGGGGWERRGVLLKMNG